MIHYSDLLQVVGVVVVHCGGGQIFRFIIGCQHSQSSNFYFSPLLIVVIDILLDHGGVREVLRVAGPEDGFGIVLPRGIVIVVVVGLG